jgi:hypothetical protein
LQELALLIGAVMSIAALFGCSPLWNSSRIANKRHSTRLPQTRQAAASGWFNSLPIEFYCISKTRISPTAIEADIGSPMMLPSETVRVRRYVASSGWRIECRTKPKVEI